MPKTVVVPLDGSEFAERAVGPARALAARADAGLVLASGVLGGPVDPEAYLVDTVARLAVVGAQTVVISDRGVVGGIERLVADAPDPVVCMSTHGRSGVGHALLGSVAEDVIGRVRAPLLLVGPAADPELSTRFDTALVCTDGSDTARAIVTPVADWVRQLHLRAWIVQVIDADVRRALHDGAQRIVEEAVVYSMAQDLLQRDAGGVNWDVLHGDNVTDEIVDYATQLPASLIAMATHGRSGFARFALGSVAVSVVHAARCPVLVVRPDKLRGEPRTEEEQR